MKFESELQRIIYYTGQIDFCYWRIQEISKHTGKMESPLEAMIDKVTGFSEHKVKASIKEVRHLVKTVIRCKPKIGFDPVKDKEFLNAIKSF